YVDDGIAALMKILENKNDVCKNQIINIGNPDNECSVQELAGILKKLFQEHPDHQNDSIYSEIIEVPADTYYGKGYQDIYTRKPSIEKARNLLGWEPKIDLLESMRLTLNSFLEENKAVTL
ncbi:MAG TPA: bifunctional UDP-4-keto-pentose/UDP-xylose synthase, partial [Syntrophaceae bacterium]|nr:bifunctional UDP-4-keto-pentose/UDP-xylose synthase [Syntrophaceae bacterium]